MKHNFENDALLQVAEDIRAALLDMPNAPPTNSVLYLYAAAAAFGSINKMLAQNTPPRALKYGPFNPPNGIVEVV
jgi:hypothetical protein